MDPQAPVETPPAPPVSLETPPPAATPAPPAPTDASQVAAPVPEEQSPHFHPTSFWQQPWVQNVLPFVTSVSVHLAILIFALLVFGIYKAVNPVPHQDQVIIPEASMAQEGPPGGVPNVGLGDPLREAAQDKDPSVTDPQWADKKGPNVDLTMSGATGDTSDAVINASAGGTFGANNNKLNVGTGAGSADGGAMAMFGAPGGGGIGPKGPVFGDGGNARFISFVCDASGSMLVKMPALKLELSKVVHNLKPIQSFGVIFFQESASDLKYLDTVLLPANPENKRKFDKFMSEVVTKGQTDPIPGIELAFRQHPQLIYLLTDGDFPDNNAVLAKIRELDKDKKVKINTIAFIDKSDKDVAFKQLLQTIAKETGGTFRLVNEEDL